LTALFVIEDDSSNPRTSRAGRVMATGKTPAGMSLAFLREEEESMRRQAGPRKKRAPRHLHDPERTLRQGMTKEGQEIDTSETMASTGDSAGSFREIVSGSATGIGVDRGESIGAEGLAAGDDSEEVAEEDF
jgi:hypothetical protein